MLHYIITKLRFTDADSPTESRLSKYLPIIKDVLIPALKNQTKNNFTWKLLINPVHEDFLKKELDFPFSPAYSIVELVDELKKENVNIQTRHDCDDWMSINYVNKIQSIYSEKIKKYDSFIIHAQPKKLIYSTAQELNLPKYHEKRCSMFLSLCQKSVKNHVLERQHGQMYEITKNIILIPEGYCKWVIHQNNISVIGRPKK